MPDMSETERQFHAAGNASIKHLLIWLTARNRTTGAPESVGIWSGRDAAEFVFGGVARVYQGAGQITGLDNIRSSDGLTVEQPKLRVPDRDGALSDALRFYDPKNGQVEIHRLTINPVTGLAVAPPSDLFKGQVSELDYARSEVKTIIITLAAKSRFLTQGLALFRSDEAQQRAFPGDQFRAYVTSTSDGMLWGDDTVRQQQDAAAKAARRAAAAAQDVNQSHWGP